MMPKREAIEKTLRSMTRSRTAEGALKGWCVLESISLGATAEPMPCELCGTRFLRGAWVGHARYKSQIAVGGTCLKAILLEAFPDRDVPQPRKRDFTTVIRRTYSGALDPGNWRQWVIANAPAELERERLELGVFGMTRSADGLRRLIAFHDAKRTYPAESLIPDYHLVPSKLRGRRNITLNEARDEALRLNSERIATKIADFALKEYIEENEAVWCQGDAKPWKALDTDGRMVVAAVEALALAGDPICSQDLAERWPRLASDARNLFCWHPKRGAAHIDPETAEFWLTHLDDYIAVNERGLWYSVSGAPRDAVQELVRRAFAPTFRLASEAEE